MKIMKDMKEEIETDKRRPKSRKRLLGGELKVQN